ncbi:hypothetical protein [Micromonospora sp. WMMD712]|uniref:hypothetical protein n=1 Tax=Micromonospora sp. WMMD712 TaxID=3016096 RepID=UPI00249AE9BC|nr:hypothetical protein [Micromonospora sp. WMMD712]WFE58629.1 hypothetical protein O7633_18040 [Micromonospora sp. WMMD712]
MRTKAQRMLAWPGNHPTAAKVVGGALAILFGAFLAFVSDRINAPDEVPANEPGPTAAVRRIGNYCLAGWVVSQPPREINPQLDDGWNGWAKSVGAVPTGPDSYELTVQGSSSAQVIITELRAKVLSRAPALDGTWVKVGCGGETGYRYSEIRLDEDPPTVVPADGENGTPLRTPYEVSLEDAEIFAIHASVNLYDVLWELEVDWASDGKTGTLVVNDNGKPFRTTGTVNVGATCTWTEQADQIIDSASDGC